MSAPSARVPGHQRLGYRAFEFLRRLIEKSIEDDVLFMAGAIAFNILVALLPLLLLGIGLVGYLLSARFGDPTEAVLAMIAENLPAVGAGIDLRAALEGRVSELVERRSGFTFFGALVFVWLATRLAATLRITLRELFDVGQDRGLLGGKVFDVQMIVVGLSLLALNLGITASLVAGVERGIGELGLGQTAVSAADVVLGNVLALASIWTLFLIIFRYVPVRRTPWRTAVVAASVSAVLYEGLKHAFSWYATSVADYGSAFGNLATLAVLVVWIYCAAVVFILGGEVAQVYTMRSAALTKVAGGPGSEP